MAAGRGGRTAIWERIAVPIALVLFVVLSTSAVREKSTTYDEILHLTAGCAYWRAGDYRLHPTNGNLVQRWQAFPIAFSGARLPPFDQPAWTQAPQLGAEYGHQFFYQIGNDLDSILRRGRFMNALFGAALGFVVWRWSRQLFGATGAMVSLVAALACPTMLAHSALATSDVAAAFGFAWATWRWERLLSHASAKNLILSLAATSFLFAAKMSAPLLAPIALLVAASRRRYWTGRIPKLAVWTALHVLAVAATLWCLYGFRYEASRDPQATFTEPWDVVLSDLGASGRAIQFARDHRLLPEAYLYGFAHTLHHAKRRPAYLNGEYSETGWWYFFPYCFAVKTPLTLFALLGAAAIASMRRWKSAHRFQFAAVRTAPLWCLFAVYWIVAMASSLNIGHRHLLPIYPPLDILAGAAAFRLRNRWAKYAVGLLIALHVFVAIRIHPHYLAYFNEFAGGPKNGYRHLCDSSLDWGQDLPGLKRRLERVAPGKPVYLAYFGSGEPAHYRIPATTLPPSTAEPLRPGLYCLSATALTVLVSRGWSPEDEAALRQAPPSPQRGMLQLRRLAVRLWKREPTENVGYSILLYDVEPDLLDPN